MSISTKKFNKKWIVIFVSFLVFGFTSPIAIFAASPSMVNLGTAGNFVVLSKTLITTTGTTSITGDIGVSPAAATFIQGFSLVADPSNTFSTSTYVNGKVYAADYAVPTPTYVGTAIGDMAAAYVDAAGRTPLTEPIDTRTGTLPLGTTFTTGIYKWSTGVNITGDIILSGSASDVWIFQIAGNLDISANTKVILNGGAQASNIFWAVAGTTTLEPGSIFEGNILSGPGVSTIAMQSLATLDGRALGQKDVTLIANNISITSATLNVVKHVVNSNGGTATANAWNLAVTSSNGGSGVGSTPGSESGTTYKLQVGKAYSISESGGPSGYSASLSSDCTIANVVANTTYNCTITNSDNVAHLIVIKHVINDNGGVLNAGNFITTITGVTTATPTIGGVESPGVNNILTSVGAYSIDEGLHVGYTKTLSTDCSGTIALGETKTCTITNNDIAPGQANLEVIKKVINNGIGSAVASSFTINVAGTTNIFPSSFAGSETGVDVLLDAGSYLVTEVAHTNYLESLSTDCSGNILSGQTKTCIITNTFIPTITSMVVSYSTNSGGSYISNVAPIIDIVKIPSPLALPSGPGSVIYTYTVSNIGTVPMYNVTVVDDSCSPMKFISGNTNADSWLDLNEKWTYQCTSTLSATHTNSVVATGWANGRIATDIATATVVVGANVTPPLIHVTKVPSPLALLAGPGIVTYTEKVTNPGVAALSNIVLTDDKCSPLNYISGDLNNDSKLDTTETWTYTCQTNLSTTTTNTARVQGTVNGFIAKDFAIVTVVVSTPGLPKTGFPPRGENMMWYVIVSAGVLVSLFSFRLIIKKYL